MENPPSSKPHSTAAEYPRLDSQKPSTLQDHTLILKCPICQSEKQKPWHRKSGYDVVECVNCGFIFTKDYPSSDFLRRFYEPSYIEDGKEYQPGGGTGRRIKYWIFSQWIRRFFPRDQVIRTLEIGCGQGDLLRAVRSDSRFEARGIDYADAPLNYAKSLGLRVDKADIQSMGFPR